MIIKFPTVLRRLMIFFGLALLACIIFLWFGQELLIFPKLWTQYIPGQSTARSDKQDDGQRFFVETSDGKRIDVRSNWKGDKKLDFVAIIFHGNGETVDSGNFLPFFKNLGVAAFTFDYRGYGQSTGWPSEEGLYRDAEAVWGEVKSRTGATPANLIILGNSIGTGPASFLAQELQPHTVILLAGFSDLPSVVAETPPYSYFKFLLRYTFPVSTYLSRLTGGCVVLAHGQNDLVIPFSNLAKLQQSLKSNIKVFSIASPDAGHNDIYYKVEAQLVRSTKQCLGMPVEDSL